jgi:hypothetical protein
MIPMIIQRKRRNPKIKKKKINSQRKKRKKRIISVMKTIPMICEVRSYISKDINSLFYFYILRIPKLLALRNANIFPLTGSFSVISSI